MFEAGERPQGKVSVAGFEDGAGHVVSSMGACRAQSSHQLTASKEKGTSVTQAIKMTLCQQPEWS